MKKSKLAEYTPDPLFADLPEQLKDPANYENVANKILKAGEAGHEHKHIIVWKRCKNCQQKFLERRAMVKKVGFSSYEQFLKWRRVMDIMINKREIRLPTK